MERTRGGAPLLSLDAVVIDTETTGLDPRKARAIELAGGGSWGADSSRRDSFRQLLRPGDGPIPAAATRYTASTTRRSRRRRICRGMAALRRVPRPSIVIGHTIGFDLAVLKRECGLAGLPWSRPRTLDTRLLAQIAAPELAGYTLEKLADWLGIDVIGRHSASAMRL